MKDFVLALLGQKHCPWCVDRPDTLWDRLMHFDQLGGIEGRPWWERYAWKWGDFNDRLGIWTLGEKWHRRRHHDVRVP
jgi:hypothetical protein